MISLKEQMKKVNQTYDNWSGSIKGQNQLILKGRVQPTIISPSYEIEVKYQLFRNPEVRVISPKLKMRADKRELPHVNSDGTLCLDFKRINPNIDLIAETFIVWITWWLYYYEIWYETGKWVARGTHPDRW
ncbi:hypothetical protein [Marinifilum sp.]|uniref:hypothetical protein n=1 Tax=Marinifilum sp. TaxID=2033137 RepID=UPI003BAC161F